MCKEKALSQSFDLVLMDMQMPVMDGYTATTLLREEEYKVPIVALTAHAMKEDLDKCLEVGCTAVITKPFKISALVEMLSRHMAQKSDKAVS